MSRPARAVCWLPFLVLCVAGTLEAQDKPQDKPQDKRKLAITDLRQVDAEFAFQGEFCGSAVMILEGTWHPVGLQVAARGDGKFDGIYYQGGLPGGGWDHQPTLPVSGQLEGNVLVLNGERLRISVSPDCASLYDAWGNVVGQLPRVNRASSTLGALPPYGARILFDGTSTEQWKGAKVTPEGYLEVGAETIQPVGDFSLHAEFRTPYMPYARGQGRGNSGFYIQRRYEVQVLDSFAQVPRKDDCAALYKTKAADVNLCFPPLSWQTYDIWFTAARFDEQGRKVSDARITVRQNGITVQDHVAIPHKTGAGKPEGPDPLPLLLQNHNNPVVFRNIWVIDIPSQPQCQPGQLALTDGSR